jgi:hypothetical protein
MNEGDDCAAATTVACASRITSMQLQNQRSTRVLEKCDFKKIAEFVEPENNFVWR